MHCVLPRLLTASASGGLIDVLDTQRVLRGILMDSLQARFDLQAAAAEIDRLRAYYPREQTAE